MYHFGVIAVGGVERTNDIMDTKPIAGTDDGAQIAGVLNAVKEHHKKRAVVYFTRQVERLKDKVHMYSEVWFHLILFPIPDKKKIVDEFLSMARRLRGGES